MQPPPPPGPPPGPPQGPPEQPQNGLGLTSMILGIASIPLLCCFSLGILTGIVSIVLGVIGKNRADQGLATNRGQAMAGLICGAVAVGLGLILIVLGLTGALDTDYNFDTN